MSEKLQKVFVTTKKSIEVQCKNIERNTFFRAVAYTDKMYSYAKM